MTMSDPRISVAMSVYNDDLFLTEAIESILGQSFGDFEFLIVDDGCTDGSGAIIDEYARRDSRIRPIHQSNRGLIASLNRAIGEARAPLIARMDGDDVALPERFARQVAFLDAHPECGVVGTNFHNIDAAGRVTECVDLHPLDHDGILAALGHYSPICHPSVMMRRAALVGVGGYRPAYCYCEDFDLWLRLSMRTRLANLPDRLLHYRRSESQVSIRQAVGQQRNAAIALLAHAERLADRPDPTEGLDSLPPLAALDPLFGRSGVGFEIRVRLAGKLGYSRAAMQGDGFGIIAEHIRAGGSHIGLWRTALRLLRFGLIAKALSLAVLLLTHRGGRLPAAF